MKHLPVLRALRVPRVLLALTALCALVLPAAAEEARMIIPEANLRFEANEDFTEVTITKFGLMYHLPEKSLKSRQKYRACPLLP